MHQYTDRRDQEHTISLIPNRSKVPSHSNQFCNCSASSCSTNIGIMGVTVKLMALIVAFLGVVSFVLGVIAENKKPVSGTPITGKDGVTCKFPADPTVPLGYLSLAFLIASTLAGLLSVFYPYKGMSLPQDILFESVGFTTFFNIALLTTGSAAAMLLWPTISDQLHLKHKFHRSFSYTCPTATTGLLGGGAFLSLDSCIFWLIALLLARNIREDFFEEVFGEKGKFGKGSKTYAEALKESI